MVLALLAACSDYRVGNKPDAVVDTTHSATPPETTPPAHSGHHSADHSALAPTCADTELPAFSWLASAPFPEEADPVDDAGVPFYEVAAAPVGWTPVALPDRGIPIGNDRVYRSTFDLPILPVDLSLDLQSDDGITVWLNGVEVGHWGGAWQVEGCVNDRAGCVVTTRVPAFEVTPLLVEGENVLAARVSNPVQNAYFAVSPLCVDR